MNKYPLAALVVCMLLNGCTSTDEQPMEPAANATSDTAESALPETPTRPFPADSFHDLLVAEFAVRRNRYDLALGNYLQQAHQTRDPGVTARATRLAQFLRADKATLDAAQLWVELEPDNLEAQYTTSTTLAKNQRPMESLAHMTIVLRNGGKTNFAAIAASALPLPEQSRQEVEAKLDELLVEYPQNTQLLTAKSLLLQQRGQTEPALKIIRQVLTLDREDLHAVVVEARLLQQLGRDDEAFLRLEKVVDVYPSNRRLRLQYARMLMVRDVALAKKQFEVLLGSSPNDPDLLLSLGLISKETDNLQDAQYYFERLLDSGQRTTEAHYYLGQLAEVRSEWQLAIEHYQQIPPGTDFLAAINRITALYLKQGRVETASEHLQGLRQQYPEHAVRLYLLESEVLLSIKMLDAGHRLLTEALLIHPDQANLLYARAMFNEKRGEMGEMERDLQRIIDQDANNAIALNTLGYVLANSGQQLDKAYQLITRALQLKPGDPAILDSLGWVEFRRGNYNEALDLLSAAYKAFPDHEVAAHLGELLWAMGQQQRAQDIWRQALELNTDSEILRETIERVQGKPAATLPAEQPAAPEATAESRGAEPEVTDSETTNPDKAEPETSGTASTEPQTSTADSADAENTDSVTTTPSGAEATASEE